MTNTPLTSRAARGAGLMADSIPLLPCPHCGARAEVTVDRPDLPEDQQSYDVRCTEPGCWVCRAPTPEVAAAWWNRRAGPAVSAPGAPQAALWTCPACGFAFDAAHTDADGAYSCPACAEIALRARVAELETADHIYDADNWEYTYEEGDNALLVEEAAPSEIVRKGRLHRLPVRWLAYIGVALDDDGNVEDGQWREFDGREAAEAARQAAIDALKAAP